MDNCFGTSLFVTCRHSRSRVAPGDVGDPQGVGVGSGVGSGVGNGVGLPPFFPRRTHGVPLGALGAVEGVELLGFLVRRVLEGSVAVEGSAPGGDHVHVSVVL